MRNYEQAYLNDPMFKHLTDTLEQMIAQTQLTPAEVRAAAMLACLHYEQRNPVCPIIPWRVETVTGQQLEYLGKNFGVRRDQPRET